MDRVERERRRTNGQKSAPRDNRYIRAFPVMLKNPNITVAQLAKELSYKESAATYLLQAYKAAYEAFVKAGWLPPK